MTNGKKQNLFFLVLIAFGIQLQAQYRFEGKLTDDAIGNTVYLSIIEDFRKLARVYPEQIFKKTQSDSLGHFVFEGNNISSNNGIYRIHIDECNEGNLNSDHYFTKCENSKSVLFIANNRDSIFFERTFENEMFCDLRSTNPKSDAFLQLDAEKEEMIFDFSEFRSEANRKLNTKKWFGRLQQFGAQFNEPLAELYAFDFLSDRRNETYSYYLNDVVNNSYYSALAERLESSYPNSSYTTLYKQEIAIDQQLRSTSNNSRFPWPWLVGLTLLLSLAMNVYYLSIQKSMHGKAKEKSLEKLSPQEQKIIALIKEDKTNKEIASILFISVSTVKTHINNLYKKLGVTTREEIKQLLG